MNTEQDNLAETLRGIASGSRRSKIARLREIFDEVEAAKDAGAGNKTIVDGLAAHGLIFDVNNFKNARSRILKERAMEGLAKAASAANKNRSTDNLRNPHKTNATNNPETSIELDEVTRSSFPINAAGNEMKARAAQQENVTIPELGFDLNISKPPASFIRTERK